MCRQPRFWGADSHSSGLRIHSHVVHTTLIPGVRNHPFRWGDAAGGQVGNLHHKSGPSWWRASQQQIETSWLQFASFLYINLFLSSEIPGLVSTPNKDIWHLRRNLGGIRLPKSHLRWKNPRFLAPPLPLKLQIFGTVNLWIHCFRSCKEPHFAATCQDVFCFRFLATRLCVWRCQGWNTAGDLRTWIQLFLREFSVHC